MLLLVALPAMDGEIAADTARVGSKTAELSGSEVRIEAADADDTDGSAAAASLDASAWREVAIGRIDPEVFELALHAARVAVERGDASDPSTLTVIDFSKPSPDERLWVYDLRARELLFEEVVSHGRGSGKTLATVFSNRPSSHQSSIGLYRTAETYVGKHGYSLRLDGLDAGFNDNARARAIVMHAAEYVNAGAARVNGYLGRSLGCPAIRPAISRALIDAIKGGGLLFAYYPDRNWLSRSPYLS